MASRPDFLPQSPGAYVQQRDWGGAIFAAVLLALVLILPSALDYLFGLATHATGVAAASLILMLALVHLLRVDRFLVIGFVAGVIVVSHLFVAAMFVPIAYTRAAGSLLLLILMIGAARTYGPWLFRLPDIDIARMTAIVRWIMVAIALASILGFAPPGGAYWERPVFPFTEPSHFALAFTPLQIDACARNRGWRRVAWLVVGFALSYYLENLSLLIAVIIAAAVSLPVSRPLPWIAAVVLTATIVNLDYFASRLDLSGYSSSFGTNFSVLVYLQGWELVLDSADQTQGWGLGFQQLGLGYVNSAAAEQIYRLLRVNLNLQDGGFLAAKAISEFGIVGLAATLAFAAMAVTSAFRLRRIAVGKVQASAGHVLALATVTGFTIDVFVRGVGYFDGAVLLFVAACFYLRQERAARKGESGGRRRGGFPGFRRRREPVLEP